VGGNVYDYVHPSGCRIHAYGPHYFRTNSPEIWDFAVRFGAFYKFEARVMSQIDGIYHHWPVSVEDVRGWTDESCQHFSGTPRNFEEASLALMPELVYRKFVKGYTEKQWGCAASSLDASLARRLEVRRDGDRRFVQHKYQGLPTDGYSAWTKSILSGIPVMLNTDYLLHKEEIRPRKHLFFTGPIDEMAGFEFGRLKYRGQMRRHEYFAETEYCLPSGQVNNPQIENGPHIRAIEWKHLMQPKDRDSVKGTVVTFETPMTPVNCDQFEYPFPDETNRRRHGQYVARLSGNQSLTVCGRLGEYRYYDMDQAIGKAIKIAHRIIAESGGMRERRKLERYAAG
jgi:UDP-galactopyranose mutase